MSAMPMNWSHDVVHRSVEIRALVASNEVPVAIKKAMDFVRDFSKRYEDEVESTVMSMEWRQIEDGYRSEQIDFAQASAARKKLARQLLGLIRAVEDGLREELRHA
ncbi:MAG: hypothetical protein M3495_10855 [Pseudomonadota bacterium]|nr:hypothetical protein [Gammaproteobacteria bacterium]MDQ3582068.1 hypothetical protein [Pseudomonadota bacterium]